MQTSSPRLNTRYFSLELDDSIPNIWHSHGVFVTHYLNAQSLLFPAGERFFLRSVLRYSKGDPRLAKDVQDFVSQEGRHAGEHEKFNRWLQSRGYAAARLEKFFSRFMSWLEQRLSPLSCLAITVCFEHFTAIIADKTLRDPRMLEGVPPTIADLWKWHAAEEIEHKGVAMDIYRRFGGGYFRRVILMSGATAVFMGFTLLFTVYLLAQERKLFNPGVWLAGFYRMYISPGPMTATAKAYLRFFKPGFHPWEIDNRSLIADSGHGADSLG